MELLIVSACSKIPRSLNKIINQTAADDGATAWSINNKQLRGVKHFRAAPFSFKAYTKWATWGNH